MTGFADSFAPGGKRNALNEAQRERLHELRMNLFNEVVESLGFMAKSDTLFLGKETMKELAGIYFSALEYGLFDSESPVRTRSELRARLIASDAMAKDDVAAWCVNRPDAPEIYAFTDKYFPKLCRLIDMDIGQRIYSSPTVNGRS